MMTIITLCTLGAELAQTWTKRTFDYMDVVAIVIGFLLAVVVFKVNERHIIKHISFNTHKPPSE